MIYFVVEESVWFYVIFDEFWLDRGLIGCILNILLFIYIFGVIFVEICIWFDKVYIGFVFCLIVNVVDLECCFWKCFLFFIWKNLVMCFGVCCYFECVYDFLGELFFLFINECCIWLLIFISLISNELFINLNICFVSESNIIFYISKRFCLIFI